MERSIRCRAWRHRFCRVMMVGLFLCLSFRAGRRSKCGNGRGDSAAGRWQSRALSPQFAFEMALTAYQSGEVDRPVYPGGLCPDRSGKGPNPPLLSGPAEGERAKNADAPGMKSGCISQKPKM